ncbi:hypothetical protein GGTG_01273 [Gaeumannomyces tritici R3-111a-1]|uniref:Uncharacterized protein n=1 Tax=Gaeumannomyces tritici (strain R3-111a-1) TaxID=644352 RepID=J3NJ39_GAET3|nr:hypothetical protein GGTG_01273 [Gaeumannomyces tritici R3-111a-1]EJT81289.1 hypothetical protein GGTG_01273 [Gaeumannomyces tritici R3-111a-1]
MHLPVNHCKDVVQNRLASGLYKEFIFEELLYKYENEDRFDADTEALNYKKVRIHRTADIYLGT